MTLKLTLLFLLLTWSNISLSDQTLTDEQSKKIAQQWADKVNRFIDKVYETEGIDYRHDTARSDALDIIIKALANDPANEDKSTDWFLNEAHAKVNAIFSTAKAQKTDDNDGDFVKIGTTEDATLTVYAFSKVTRTGNTVKMWDLKDFKKPQKYNGIKYLSSKAIVEINCRSEEFKFLYVGFYSKNMGSGDNVSSTNMYADWQPIIPDSIGSITRDYACNK